MMRALILMIVVAISLVACAPTASTPSAQPGGAPGARSAASAARTEPQASRTAVAAIRVEPASIAGEGLQPSSLTLGATVRTFNAGLTIIDDHDQPGRYLADILRQPHTDTWNVH